MCLFADMNGETVDRGPPIFQQCSIAGVYRLLGALKGGPPGRNVSQLVRDTRLGRSQVLKYLKFAVSAGLAWAGPPVIRGTAGRTVSIVYNPTQNGNALWVMLKAYDEKRFRFPMKFWVPPMRPPDGELRQTPPPRSGGQPARGS